MYEKMPDLSCLIVSHTPINRLALAYFLLSWPFPMVRILSSLLRLSVHHKLARLHTTATLVDFEIEERSDVSVFAF